jgi:hypothetical protein
MQILILIIEHTDPGAEINRPDLSDSGGYSDDGHAGVNVSNEDVGGGCDDNDEDDDNEDRALCDKKTTISLRYHFVPHLVVSTSKRTNACFPKQIFSALFSAILFEEIAAETNMYVREKINEAMPSKIYLIWVGWEDIITEELIVFHAVIFNMARRQGLFL